VGDHDGGVQVDDDQAAVGAELCDRQALKAGNYKIADTESAAEPRLVAANQEPTDRAPEFFVAAGSRAQLFGSLAANNLTNQGGLAVLGHLYALTFGKYLR